MFTLSIDLLEFAVKICQNLVGFKILTLKWNFNCDDQDRNEDDQNCNRCQKGAKGEALKVCQDESPLLASHIQSMLK